MLYWGGLKYTRTKRHHSSVPFSQSFIFHRKLLDIAFGLATSKGHILQDRAKQHTPKMPHSNENLSNQHNTQLGLFFFFSLQQVDDSLLDKQEILRSDQSGAFPLPSFLLTRNFPLTDKIYSLERTCSLYKELLFSEEKLLKSKIFLINTQRNFLFLLN